MGQISNLSPAMKAVITAETGIVFDGELSLEDLRKAYEYIRGVAKELNPGIDDDLDAAIDRIEGAAMKRKHLAKTALLTMAGGIRKIFGIPDDDDNITQR